MKFVKNYFVKGLTLLMFLFCALLPLTACNQAQDDSTVDEEPTVISNITFDVYDEAGTQVAEVDFTTENTVTLFVNVRYIIEVDLSSYGGAFGFTNAAISFGYDSDYIKIEEYDSEDEISHKFYFMGLQSIENTTLTISVEAANAPKDIIITFCNHTQDDSTVDEEPTVISNITFDVYDADENHVAEIDSTTENIVTLSVNVRYIIEVDLFPYGGAFVFTNAAISFDYDSDYISIEEYDSDDEISHRFYFTGLQTTESTTLTITISKANAPKDIIITLV